MVFEDTEGYKSVNYDGLIPVLIEALNEQKQRIDQLEKQLSQQSTKTQTGDLIPAKLYQNQPNPFDQITKIKMYLPDDVQQAPLLIYNLNGQTMKQIPMSNRGETSIDIEGGSLASGMYLYALIADHEEVDLKRMILK